MNYFKRSVRITKPVTMHRDVQNGRDYCVVPAEEKVEQGRVNEVTITLMDKIGDIVYEYSELDDYIVTEHQAIEIYDDNGKMLSTIQSRINKLSIYDRKYVHILDYDAVSNQLKVYNEHTELSFEEMMRNPEYTCAVNLSPIIIDPEEVQRSIDLLGADS